MEHCVGIDYRVKSARLYVVARESDWMPITPKTGSLFHTDCQRRAVGRPEAGAAIGVG